MLIKYSNNIYSDYSLEISEMNDNNVIRDKREELGTLYYKLFALLV